MLTQNAICVHAHKTQTQQHWHISLYFATVNQRRRTLDSPKSLRTSLRNRSTPCDRLETCKRREGNLTICAFFEKASSFISQKMTSLVYAHVFTRIRPRLFGGLSIVAGKLVELVRCRLTSRQGLHVHQPINQGRAVAAAHETAT